MQKTISVNSIKYTVTKEPHGDVFIEEVDNPDNWLGGPEHYWADLLRNAVVDSAYMQHGLVAWDLYVWDKADSIIERLEGNV